MVISLWKKIRRHHRDHSTHFKKQIDEMTWEERKRELLEISAKGGLLVELVKETTKGVIVGYCLTSLDKEKHGEIESIYLEPDYRGQGIGMKLIEGALAWLDSRGALQIQLSIGAGNEEVIGFYRLFGFEIRATIMERVGPSVM